MNNARITKLRQYLFDVINTLTNDNNYQINADMLSKDINDYSLDKIPTDSYIESWIIGDTIKQDTFSFRTRKAYSQDTINNLTNIAFFERFEDTIKSNNEAGVLPDIDGIESIECLNCGTMIANETNSAIFNIQIRITYRDNDNETYASL